MNERALALSGATWLAIGFAGISAIGALPALARLPFAVVDVGATTQVAVGAAAAAVTLAFQVALLVVCIRRAGAPTEKPPWTTVIVTAVLAVFAYPLSVGSSMVVTAVGARNLGPEGVATIAFAGSVLGMVGGVLHLVLLVGVLIALAVRWQRATEAEP